MNTQRHPEPLAPDISVGHEERDVHARPVVLAMLGLAAVGVSAFVLMFLLFNGFATMLAKQTKPPSPLAATYGLQEPPEPRLQKNPLADMQELRARDAAALSAYAWVDRDAGVVRIPIEHAIGILAARGLPARPAAPKGSR